MRLAHCSVLWIAGILLVGFALDPLSWAGVEIESYRDRSAFEARLGSVKVVGFDDVDTSTDDPASFTADRYQVSHGVVIGAQGGGGQFAGRTFTWGNEFRPVSSPNTYAAGPPWGSERNTVVTFHSGAQPGVVAGFGLYFIDADWPDWPTPGAGACSLKIFGAYGGELGDSGTVSGGNGEQLFFGFVAVDSDTKTPVPVIARALITAGSGWPEDDNGEGVVLDDFIFGKPVPDIRITDITAADEGITLRWVGQPSWYFTVQFSSDLLELSSWADLPGYVDLPGPDDEMSAIDTNAPALWRFYRIRAAQ